MNSKTTGIIIAILGLLLILLMLYFIFFFDFMGGSLPAETPVNQNSTVVTPKTDNQPTASEPIIINNTEPAVAPTATGKSDLERIAYSFAERFGSYSSHSDYSNITDLKIYMTDSLQAWADDFIDNASYTDMYVGITTKTLSTETISFDNDEGVATVKVSTQRRKSTGTMSNSETINQDLVMEFKKVDDVWKVDKAEWQN